MRLGYHRCWIAILTAAACHANAAAGSPGAPPAICVHVYDYAGVAAGEMARSEEVAGALLARGGIETDWVEFRAERKTGVRLIGGNGNHGLGNESGPGASGPAHLVVSIYPRAMAQVFRLSGADFGFALLPSEKGEFGNRANVFFERITLLADASEASRALLLGHAMAHEIGHLLLGAGSHARSGIMRGPWRQREVRQAATGMLHFSDDEARRMQKQVRARMRAENGELRAAFAAAMKPPTPEPGTIGHGASKR